MKNLHSSKSLKEGEDFMVKDLGNGATLLIHHTEASYDSFKTFFNHLLSVGREPSTNTNLSKSSSYISAIE